MSSTLLCLLCFVTSLVAITAWLYLGLNSGAHKGGGERLKRARKTYEKADTWDKKIVYAVFNSMFLLTVGFWGFLVACGGGVLSVAAAICGHNPFPYYLEMWDRFLRLMGVIAEHGNDTPPADDPQPAST